MSPHWVSPDSGRSGSPWKSIPAQKYSSMQKVTLTHQLKNFLSQRWAGPPTKRYHNQVHRAIRGSLGGGDGMLTLGVRTGILSNKNEQIRLLQPKFFYLPVLHAVSCVRTCASKLVHQSYMVGRIHSSAQYINDREITCWEAMPNILTKQYSTNLKAKPWIHAIDICEATFWVPFSQDMVIYS